jgi:hypothetical protein
VRWVSGREEGERYFMGASGNTLLGHEERGEVHARAAFAQSMRR